MNREELRSALLVRSERAGIAVQEHVLELLLSYFELLRRWNRTINLTALPLEPPTTESLDRLLVEPLVVADRLGDIHGRWFDLGSGGGSPAIPIKLVIPHLSLTMVESRERKAAFLRETARELQLQHVGVSNARFEALGRAAGLAGTADLVTARAVRVDGPFLALCSLLLKVGGRLVLVGYAGSEPTGFRSDPKSGFFRRIVPRGTIPSA